jgi:4-amino-4-deoxy-L-arabinose transferase-like glycosyltransferase
MNGIPFSRRQVFIAILFGLFAFIIRLLFILFYSNNPLAGGDSVAFWSYADSISKGHGFRSALEPWLADRPPLYSYFLAVIFILGGKYQYTVFLVQAVLWSYTTFIFYLSMTKIMDGIGSLFAGLLFAIFPHFLLFTKEILTEAIYIPIWVFLLTCLLFIKIKVEAKYLFGTGIFLGLLALVRREAILPGGIMVIVLLGIYYGANWRKIILILSIIFSVAGLVILPWLIRNYFALGKPVLSSSAGVNFMVGNNPLGNGAYTPPPPDWQVQFKGLSELERNQRAWDLSFQWIRRNPMDFLNLLPKKLLVLWGPAYNLILDSVDFFLFLCCLPGLIRVVQRKDSWNVIGVISLLPVLTTTLIGLVFVGAWRYRLIVYPGLIVLAGYGSMQFVSLFSCLVTHIRQRRNNAVAS